MTAELRRSWVIRYGFTVDVLHRLLERAELKEEVKELQDLTIGGCEYPLTLPQVEIKTFDQAFKWALEKQYSIAVQASLWMSKVYQSTYSDVRPLDTQAFTKTLHEIKLEDRRPLLAAYIQLMQATLQDPRDPVRVVLEWGPLEPRVYGPAVPTMPEEDATYQLPPVLNRLVYEYAFAPTCSQVMSRLTSLL